MKTVLLDADLILQGLTDDGDFHLRFVALWQTLQSSKLQGYITKLDLARLHRQLDLEIGPEASERLLSAFGRILKVWAGDCYSFDAIITENPQLFREWDIPTLSVTEFLQRHELDSLLKQTSEASVPLTKIPEPPSYKTNKIGTAVLLMVPVLLELWMHREHLTGVFSVIAKNRNEQDAEESLKSGLAPNTSPEAISVVEHAAAIPTRSPSTRLLFANLPGLGISVEDDLSLDLQLDNQGDAVTVRLQIPQDAPQSKDVVAATLYRADNSKAIAQIVMTEAGLTVIANPSVGNGSQAVSYSPAGFNAADGHLIAIVHRTPEGGLTTRLNAYNSSQRGDRGETAQSSPETVVAVRSVNQYSSFSAAPLNEGIEIRFEVKPDGSNSVTIDPLLNPNPSTNNPPPGVSPSPGIGPSPGLGGGGGIETPNEQPPNTQLDPRGNYDSSWVLNNNGNWVPGYTPSPVEPPPEFDPRIEGNSNNLAEGMIPQSPHGFTDSSMAVGQVAVLNVSQVDPLYAISLPDQDDLLSGWQNETAWVDITNEGFIGTVSPSITTTNSTLTISIRNLGEIRTELNAQVYSTGSLGTAGLPSNATYTPFPNYSITPAYEGLSGAAISGV